MKPEEKKKTKTDEDEDVKLEKEDIPEEDIDMIREKNDRSISSAYESDNSFGDDR
jgi:NACalpha-BTF3-like transcription factor